MNRVDRFKQRLTEDTSLVDLKEYTTGIRVIDSNIGTKKEKAELLAIFIPELIKQQEKDIADEFQYWYNAPLFRLAFQHCLETRRPKSDLFYVAIDIINRISGSRKNPLKKNEFLKNELKKYYNKYRNAEVI